MHRTHTEPEGTVEEKITFQNNPEMEVDTNREDKLPGGRMELCCFRRGRRQL